MSLTDEERDAVVKYRIEKSMKSFQEAEKVSEICLWNIAANRLYYALYYAASALLLSKGIATKRHSGLITQMHLNFVKTGILTVEEGSLFKVMFELRHEGDYEDFVDVERADIEEYIPQVKELVDKLKNLIEK